MSDITKRQHYVQKASLKPWTDKNNSICVYLKKENRIFRSSTKDVGVEDFFYALPDLNLNEKKVALGLSRKANLPDILITSLFAILENEKNAISPEEILYWRKKRKNFIEERHASIENAFPLKRILNQDLSFWRTDEKVTHDCVSYLYHQLFRTKRTQETVTNLQFQDPSPLNHDIDWSKVWKYESFSLPLKVITVMMENIEQYNLEIISTDSKIPFIIGDQPVINLAFIPHKRGQPLSHMFLYYPISPILALCFYHRDSYIQYHGKLTESDVDRLNRKQIETSLQQVFSTSEKIFEKYCSL
jgi:hypothetical protein